MASPMAYGRIQATAATHTTAAERLDPLTHCLGLGIEPTHLQQPELL